MSAGYFFRPEDNQPYQDFSWIYHRVCICNNNERPDDYPISVVLSADKIEFLFHGFREDNRVQLKNYSDAQKSAPLTGYVSGRMFSLPLNKNSADGLEEFLSGFNILKSDDPELRDYNPLVNAGVYTEKEHSFFMYKKETLYLDSYFEAAGQFFRQNKTPQKGIYSPVLVLDFLFDFFHSNTFGSSPYYDSLKHLILSHRLLGAIVFKLNHLFFCYCNTAVLAQKKKSLTPVDFELEYLANQGAKSTRDWLFLLLQPGNEKVISLENNWFNDIETEVINVLKNIPKNVKSKVLPELKEKIVQWRQNRYDLLRSTALQIGNVLNFRTWLFGLKFFILIFVFCCLFTIFYSSLNYNIFLALCATFGSTILSLGVIGTFNTVSQFILGSPRPLLFFLVFVVPFEISTGLVFGFTNRFFIIGTIAFMGFILIGWRHWYLTKEKPAPIKLTQSIPSLIRFFQPRVLFLSGGLWTLIVANSFLWLPLDFSINERQSIIFLLFILAIGTIFLVGHFEKFIKIKGFWIRFFEFALRTTIFLVFGVTYSLIIGAVGMNWKIQDQLVNKGELGEFFSKKDMKDTILFSKISDTLAREKAQNLFTSLQEEEVSIEKQDSLNQKIDRISKSLSPVDDEIYHLLLPYLYHKKDGNNLGQKVLIKKEFPSLIFHKISITILPDMLIFYTIVCLSLGVIIETGWKSKSP